MKTFSKYVNQNKHIFVRLLSLFSFFSLLSYYLYLLINAFQKRTTPGVFDESLRILSALYTSAGFTPYKDYAFVYMPGLILKNSFLNLDLTSEFQLLFVVNIVILSILLYFVYVKTKSFLFTNVILLLVVINFHSLTTSITETLMLGLITSIYLYLHNQKSKYIHYIIGILTIGLVFLKWERIVIVTILLFFSSYIFSSFIKNNKKVNIPRLRFIFKIFFLSCLSSIVLLLIYILIYKSDFFSALYFIFIVPFKIGPFRKLPIFSEMMLSHGKIFYFYLIITLGIICYYFTKFQKRVLETTDIVLLFFLISTIPYALGRVDIPHALPLISITTFIVLIHSSKKQKLFMYLFPIMILYLLHSFSILSFTKNLVLQSNKVVSNNSDPLQDCRDKLMHTEYQSIFTGREDYSHYIYNYAILYLVNPSKKPASKYISDEPGLQNTCYDGKEITKELTVAKKPMIAFIDKSLQGYEPNMSSHMKSCGYIEKWLSTRSYQVINTCKIQDAKFEIRIYN